ncbi:hypothetical protein [Magnetospirillum molischianum]|uniref:Holliday junction resolvase RuvC n=1 Tax=Magnetospirillum molischianum DSM 120 TaxID=1150626 RepID=H8FYB4_MAGML|nr:hypothetical protein [Magnetospirillum molischianum]CCG43352.1 conserved hypothetical protein [Magnetospirillum molischianum DSM 120]
MSNIIKVVGFDPSLANFGMVAADLDIDTLKLKVTGFKLVETEKDKSKQVRKGSDDLRRCREIIQAMRGWADPDFVAFGFAEVPSGGAKSANALKALSMATAILGACPVELVEVNPTEVKLATVGKKTAAKEDMIEWVIERHPEAPWLTYKRLGKVEFNAKNEHLADGVCAIYAGLQSQQFKHSLAMMRSALKLAA